MQASNTRCKHLYVETAWASTYRCFVPQPWYLLWDAFSSTIRASNLSATMWSYRSSHTSRPRFHFPPAYFTWSYSSTSAKPTRTSTMGEHAVMLTSHWNRRGIMYPTLTYQAIFLDIYKYNRSQFKGMAKLGGEMLDVRFGSIRRVCKGWFSEMPSPLWP